MSYHKEISFKFKRVLTHFLVRQHGVALQMRAEERGIGSIVLAEDGAVDVVEPVARDQAVSARRTGETLKKENKTNTEQQTFSNNKNNPHLLAVTSDHCMFLKKLGKGHETKPVLCFRGLICIFKVSAVSLHNFCRVLPAKLKVYLYVFYISSSDVL